MMSLDMLAASKLELVSKEVASAMDDGLVAVEPEELMLLPNSVLTAKVSLLAVRGVAAEVISDDVVPDEVTDGTLSDEKTSTSPEPSNSVVPETEAAPVSSSPNVVSIVMRVPSSSSSHSSSSSSSSLTMRACSMGMI